MLTAVLIDDEQRARSVMQALLQEHVPEVEVVGMADDVPGGVIAINKYKPDLVFLDVEMPNYNGFQLLSFFETIDFHIVFTTAYSEYALQAFQVSAVDYLLKPIQIDQLQRAVEKVKTLRSEDLTERYKVLADNVSERGIQKIALPMANGLHFIPLEDILYLQADGAYTHFLLKEGRKLVVSKKLKDFEDALTGSKRFMRVHRSFIVNLDCIRQYVKQDGGYLVMDNGDTVSLSRDLREEFLAMMGEG